MDENKNEINEELNEYEREDMKKLESEDNEIESLETTEEFEDSETKMLANTEKQEEFGIKPVESVKAEVKSNVEFEETEQKTVAEEAVNATEQEAANATEQEAANAAEQEVVNAAEQETANAAEQETTVAVTTDIPASEFENLELYVDQASMEQAGIKQEKKRKIKKILAISGISLAATIVVAYLGIAVWFMFHYNDHTYINNVDMSYHTTAEVRDQIDDFVANYSLTLKMRGDDVYTILPSDINLQITPVFDEMDAKHQQNGLLWPFYISNEKQYTITYKVSYDEELLDSFLSSMECLQKENMVPADNAYVVVKDAKSVIVEEGLGTIIDYDILKKEICNALNTYMLDIDLTESDCYVDAQITSDSEEIVEIKESLDEYLNMVITYQIDEVTWELDASTFGDWLYYYNGSWCFSARKVRTYVEELAEQYNTVGTTRNFVTYSGKHVEEVGPRYGWTIDEDAEFYGLLDTLRQGSSQTRTPEFSQVGAAYNSFNDIGYNYIEVDLSNQHVYVFIDGKMVYDTPCVTGCVANGNGTPDGLYEITYKQSPAVLKGEDYETPVTYWMPFNRGIGLHDATWRGSFGGSIYQYNGSHGCVNLPYSAASIIYSYAYSGMPVICYY